MDKDNITSLLHKELGVSETIALALKNAMEDAIQYNANIQAMYINGLSITEYKEELNKAITAIKKVNNALKILGKENVHSLESAYYDANERDTYMLIDGFNFECQINNKNTMEVVCEKIERAFIYSLENINTPGKGKARRQGKNYKAGIEKLAEYFEKEMPKHKISASPESLFYRYVAIWLENYMNVTDLTDIRRHIRNAIK